MKLIITYELDAPATKVSNYIHNALKGNPDYILMVDSEGMRKELNDFGIVLNCDDIFQKEEVNLYIMEQHCSNEEAIRKGAKKSLMVFNQLILPPGSQSMMGIFEGCISPRRFEPNMFKDCTFTTSVPSNLGSSIDEMLTGSKNIDDLNIRQMIENNAMYRQREMELIPNLLPTVPNLDTDGLNDLMNEININKENNDEITE